jgi:DNA-binding response OmpR family regulator
MPTRSLTLDRTQPRVFVDQTPIQLTKTQHRILGALIAARGHVMHRKQLSALLFGNVVEPDDQSIERAVHELRRKLGPASGCVQLVSPDAYVFCAPTDQGAAS